MRSLSCCWTLDDSHLCCCAWRCYSPGNRSCMKHGGRGQCPFPFHFSCCLRACYVHAQLFTEQGGNVSWSCRGQQQLPAWGRRRLKGVSWCSMCWRHPFQSLTLGVESARLSCFSLLRSSNAIHRSGPLGLNVSTGGVLIPSQGSGGVLQQSLRLGVKERRKRSCRSAPF